MTVTTLERLELTVEDFTPGCECYLDQDCPEAATASRIMRFNCGCFKLMCLHCVSTYLTYVGSNLGRLGYCRPCGRQTTVFKISDVVVSIDPL
jgi:hypothetical protein